MTHPKKKLLTLVISWLVPTLALAQDPAAAPAPVAADAAPVAVQAPAAPVEPAKPVEVAPAKPAEKFAEGSLGLLLQGWFQGSTDTRFSLGAPASPFKFSGQPNAGTSTFKLRRAELSYDGKVAGKVKFRVMIDPTIIQNGPIGVKFSNSDPSKGEVAASVTVKDILQDASVSFMLPKHELKLGQFKVPLTMEGFGSSGKLDFAERTMMGRTFGDSRDIGVMVSADGIPYVDYQVAVVNGAGKNALDNQPWKDVVGRAVIKPIKGVSVGGSGALGQVYDSGLKINRQKNRGGAEIAVEMYGATLKAEYMGGRDSQGSFTTAPAGYYVTAGYRLTDDLQAVARYESWDSDTRTSVDECREGGVYAGNGARCAKFSGIAAGLNYDLAPSVLNGAKLQLNYYRDMDAVHEVSAHEVFLVTQVKF